MVWDKYKVPPPNSETTGLPQLEEGRADTMGFRTSIIGTIIPLAFATLGYGLSYLIYKFGDTESYDDKRDVL